MKNVSLELPSIPVESPTLSSKHLQAQGSIQFSKSIKTFFSKTFFHHFKLWCESKRCVSQDNGDGKVFPGRISCMQHPVPIFCSPELNPIHNQAHSLAYSQTKIGCATGAELYDEDINIIQSYLYEKTFKYTSTRSNKYEKQQIIPTLKPCIARTRSKWSCFNSSGKFQQFFINRNTLRFREICVCPSEIA